MNGLTISWICFQVSCPIKGSEQTLVHAGFSVIYTGLRYYTPPPGPLTPPKETDQPVELSAVLASANSVMVAGHSLGAALGISPTLDIALNIKCPVSSYNFGSPMVGDPTFASVFNQLLVTGAISGNFRVANGMDVVPTAAHVFYPPDSSQECDYLQVDSYCPVDSGVLSVLSDPHSLSNYVIGLRNINAMRGAGSLMPSCSPKKHPPVAGETGLGWRRRGDTGRLCGGCRPP